MPMPLALNRVAGGAIGAIHCLLKGSCEPDFPEMTAAAALRALSVAGKTADALACKRLQLQPDFLHGLLAVTKPATGAPKGKARGPGRAAIARNTGLLARLARIGTHDVVPHSRETGRQAAAQR